MNAAPSTPDRDIGVTQVTPALARMFAGAVLALLGAVTAVEWHAAGAPALAAFRIPVQPTADDRVWTWMMQPNRELLSALQSFERRVEDEGWLARRLIPPVQRFKLSRLRLGNESVYAGRDGWLQYRPDVDFVTGRGFLDPGRLRRRALAPGAAVQSDPVRAITDFAAQLRERGIVLVVMPTPVKPELTASTLGGPVTGRVTNASFAGFVQRLQAAGVTVFDPAPHAGGDYLRADTHWTPSAVERVAAALADVVREAAGLDGTAAPFERVARLFTGRGDLVAMLGEGAPASHRAGEAVTVQEVVQGAARWQPDPAAAVLLLGDSFSNIFSQDALGWGRGAGLAEQLSFHLRQPVDRIVRNDAGAHATRATLARELQRGRDRLAGKRVVVWQFANRELAQGDWKLIPMRVERPPVSRFLLPEPGAAMEVRGTVAALSALPLPGRVPYADHIAAVHLVDVKGGTDAELGEAYVFLWSMTNHTPTAAGRWRAGDDVRVRLRRWSDVAADLESFNRSELEDERLLLAEPAWGENVP